MAKKEKKINVQMYKQFAYLQQKNLHLTTRDAFKIKIIIMIIWTLTCFKNQSNINLRRFEIHTEKSNLFN